MPAKNSSHRPGPSARLSHVATPQQARAQPPPTPLHGPLLRTVPLPTGPRWPSSPQAPLPQGPLRYVTLWSPRSPCCCPHTLPTARGSEAFPGRCVPMAGGQYSGAESSDSVQWPESEITCPASKGQSCSCGLGAEGGLRGHAAGRWSISFMGAQRVSTSTVTTPDVNRTVAKELLVIKILHVLVL